ncbi:hypothetical protein WR25_13157 [Diploscapter pachys]|uniref:Uncharacterized protein n=1 Tax=Diploscapter pachys TaxID=2018661 RepID=A0A2A2LPZ6_9BILA|nr:hypothetical protein WR25_13157 [Diploscapter pachys]
MSLIRALDTQDRVETTRILETMPSEVSIRDSEDRVALHYAAETMDLDTFKKIYEQDPILVDSQDKYGHTPLMNALMVGRTDLADFLLSKGADLHHIDKEGHTLVHWAVVCGQLDALTYIINKGTSVNVADHTERAYPIHYATVADDLPHELVIAILHTLLRNGANPNCRDADERTPILWCASNGNLEAMVSLKQAGGEILAVDRDRLGVLHCAASHGFHEIIDYFMENAPRTLIDQRERAGHTALFYAVTYGHYEAAKRLLHYGANPNFQDHRLRTPSHCAAAKGQLRMLKLLKQYNASFEIQNYRGDLPFHEAIQTGSKDVVEWLLSLHPSSLDAANHEGRTALHLAAANGNLEMVVYLCSKECFINPLMLYKGEVYTPLDVAKRQNHQVVVEYLTMRYQAKSADEIPEEERTKNKMTFEEQIVNAKLARGKHLEALELHERMSARQRSNSDLDEEGHTGRSIKHTVSNTEARRLQSAGTNRVTVKLPKSTSTTDLANGHHRYEGIRSGASTPSSNIDVDVESVIRSEVSKIRKERGINKQISSKSEKSGSRKSSFDVKETIREERGTPSDDLDIDEEFEDLPAISDETETGDELHKENHRPVQSILKRNHSEERKKKPKFKLGPSTRLVSGNVKSNGRTTKTKKDDGSKESDENREENNRIARIRRAELGSTDMDDYEIYEDDWEEMSPLEKSVGKDANRKYVHEKAIFQELTHLKRMQIQYGKVQERILVRSLINNFCKMHGLNPSDFKFQTFYSWEKFLYEQLKLIYLDERERLMTAKGPRANLSKFESRLKAAKSSPLNDRIRDMSRIYATSTMTSTRPNGKAMPKEKKTEKFVCGEGGKRCDCLDKHLLIKND